jgi:hypothetical protein
MRYRFLALLVVASVVFQSMAAAGQLIAHAADGVEHLLMHAEKAPHHHDDDGSLHEDDSDQSARHLQSDNALNLVALPSLAATGLQQAPPLAVTSSSVLEVPPPVLDGPNRPPRIAG